MSTTGVFSTVSSVLTSSCSTGISSYAGSDSGAYHHPLGTSYSTCKYGSTTNKSFDDTKKSLDDQLKELDSQLDSQLLSKVGASGQVNLFFICIEMGLPLLLCMSEAADW